MRYWLILSIILICFIGAGGCGSSRSGVNPLKRIDTGHMFSNKLKETGALTDMNEFMKISKENSVDFMQYITRDLYNALVQTGGIYRQGFEEGKFETVKLESSDLREIQSGSYEFSGTHDDYVYYKFNNLCNDDGVCIDGKLSASKADLSGGDIELYEGEYLKIYLKDKQSEIEALFRNASSEYKVCSRYSDRKHEEITANKTDENYLVSVAFKSLKYGSDNIAKSGKVVIWTRDNCHDEIVFEVIEGGVVKVAGEVMTYNLKILDLSEANKKQEKPTKV